jgi:CRISPR-associated protein Cmr4
MSKNLWYEEIVPRDSRFFFIIGSPKDDNLSNEFSEHVKSEPVQIGANASIGYGFCNIEII